MYQHRYLKISYHANRRLIAYKLGSNTYDEILETVIHSFKIPRNRKSSLYFTNMIGKIFSRRQLNNYLALHPNPKITFYLRYKNNGIASKIRKATIAKQSRISSTSVTTQTPKTQKRQRDCHDDDDYDLAYPTTPVFRMNCFIGVYPSKCSPPPVKRVRFSEDLNSIRIIPARTEINTTKNDGVLRRIQSFYEAPHTTEDKQLSQQATNGLILNENSSEKINQSTGTSINGACFTTQLYSPLRRTKSFLNIYPAPQPLISNFFKKKARRMLFAKAQKLTE